MRYVILYVFGLLLCHPLWAQDPQFTQFYAAPLYLNPAYTGSNGNIRAAMNYRNQWPGTDAQSVSMMASYDQSLPTIRSGIGILAKRDEQFNNLGSTFRSQELALSYSYAISITEGYTIQPAIQLGYVIRDLDFNSFLFGDQITDRGITTNPTAEQFTTDRLGYFDVSTGFLVFSDRFWFGAAVHHLNEPGQSWLGGIHQLPMKTTVHFGYVIATKTSRRRRPNLDDGTIIPVLQYQAQGRSDQFSAGFYANFRPIVFGAWYRGLPIKRYNQTIHNNDAIAVLFGIYLTQVTLAYSYDLTVSQLSPISRGAHELSLTFDIKPKDNRKQPRRGYRGPSNAPSPWRRRF